MPTEVIVYNNCKPARLLLRAMYIFTQSYIYESQLNSVFVVQLQSRYVSAGGTRLAYCISAQRVVAYERGKCSYSSHQCRKQHAMFYFRTKSLLCQLQHYFVLPCVQVTSHFHLHNKFFCHDTFYDGKTFRFIIIYVTQTQVTLHKF